MVGIAVPTANTRRLTKAAATWCEGSDPLTSTLWPPSQTAGIPSTIRHHTGTAARVYVLTRRPGHFLTHVVVDTFVRHAWKEPRRGPGACLHAFDWRLINSVCLFFLRNRSPPPVISITAFFHFQK